MRKVEQDFRAVLRKNGFVTAADDMDLDRVKPHVIGSMLKTWDNYPKCMDVYPTKLTPKDYDTVMAGR